MPTVASALAGAFGGTYLQVVSTFYAETENNPYTSAPAYSEFTVALWNNICAYYFPLNTSDCYMYLHEFFTAFPGSNGLANLLIAQETKNPVNAGVGAPTTVWWPFVVVEMLRSTATDADWANGQAQLQADMTKIVSGPSSWKSAQNKSVLAIVASWRACQIYTVTWNAGVAQLTAGPRLDLINDCNTVDAAFQAIKSAHTTEVAAG